jgi:SAM-dependent methyltransferase
MPSHDALPRFTEHGRDTKSHLMVTPIEPPPYMQRFLDRCLQAMGRQDPEGVRVLDVGCGRGDTVAWLLSRGWDAHGVDISEVYLDRGRDYLHRRGADPHRLQLLCDDSTYPFPDASFDLVLSDQVMEHVSNLDAFGREIARVSAIGAAGLHIHPAKWRPIEVHMATPFVHWLPKGPARRAAIAGALRLGMAAPYFKDLSQRDRTRIFVLFSETETFYRPVKQTVATLERYGLRCDVIASSRDKVSFHMPQFPKATIPVFGWLYRHNFSVVLNTRRVCVKPPEGNILPPRLLMTGQNDRNRMTRD